MCVGVDLASWRRKPVAVASTAALAWMARRQRRRSSRLTVAAAGCLAAAHGIFWSVVQPANVEMMRWPLDAIPQDWAKWRNRWEYGHAVRAGLVTTALGGVDMVRPSGRR